MEDNVEFVINEDGLHTVEQLLFEELERRSNEVVEEAKELVPVRTGALRDSIDILSKDEDEQVINIESELDYAIIVEMGTSNREPSPYLRPALDDVWSR